jgi:membrane-associated phospholipid phosphatase
MSRHGVRSSIVLIVTGAVVLVGSVAASRAPLTSLEVEIFRAVNDQPESLYPVVWPLMQYGTFLRIPVLSIVALVFRRVRLALGMLLAGVSVYLIAKVMKEVVDRGRPAALLSDVHDREVFGEGSLGFPSGHAAVAMTLTFIVWRHLGPRWGLAALAVAAVVMVGRMYVAAHLPLDLVGGAALGTVAAGIANLVAPPKAAFPREDG